MPLLAGSTPDVIAENIRREMAAGRPRAQAVAIALRTADRFRTRVGALTEVKRWFYWYIRRPGATTWTTFGPQQLTDAQAFQAEFATKSRYLGTEMYRLVYDPKLGNTWVFDVRNDRELLAGAPPRTTYA